MSELKLTQEWDKVFPKSDKVDHEKVTYRNIYGIPLAADVYKPKGVEGKLPAIAVCGPYGAVKEQSAGLYAQTLAECGFLTLAFDPSFYGESGGTVRYMASPDINTEDYSAAVDYFILRGDVDEERIGILGICGWGGIAVNAAVNDTRIKATVTSAMGALDTFNHEQRIAMRKSLNAQRTVDIKSGTFARMGGVPKSVPEDAPLFSKEYTDYYQTPRGYHPRSMQADEGWNTIAFNAWFSAAPLAYYADEIESAVLMIFGENAYDLSDCRNLYEKLVGDNKELLIVPGATHVDLYDRTEIIPFDKIVDFYHQYLK